MAEQGSTSGSTARVNSLLSLIQAANAILDPGCTSVLQGSEVGAVYDALQPVFELCGTLASRKVKLDEAMDYMRETRLCELLLSLIERWPWAEMRVKSGASTSKYLLLLLRLLCSLSMLRAPQRTSGCLCGDEQEVPFLLGAHEQSDHSGCSAGSLLLCVCRYKQMQVYEVLTGTATSLVDYVCTAQPLCEAGHVVTLGQSLQHIQQARHQRVTDLHLISVWQLSLAWCQRRTSKPYLHPQVVHAAQKCAPNCCILGMLANFILKLLQQEQRAIIEPCRGCISRSVPADSARVMCRAPPEAWGVSTPAACLLLSQYVPATAQLLAEFRRLRDSLSPAQARAFQEYKRDNLRDAKMITMVRL